MQTLLKKECQDLGFREKEFSIFSASSNSSELIWSAPNLSEMFSGWSCCRRFPQAHQFLKYLFLWIPSLYLWSNCWYLWKKLCKPFAHLQTLLAKGLWGFFVLLIGMIHVQNSWGTYFSALCPAAHKCLNPGACFCCCCCWLPIAFVLSSFIRFQRERGNGFVVILIEQNQHRHTLSLRLCLQIPRV